MTKTKIISTLATIFDFFATMLKYITAMKLIAIINETMHSKSLFEMEKFISNNLVACNNACKDELVRNN